MLVFINTHVTITTNVADLYNSVAVTDTQSKKMLPNIIYN